MTKRRTRARRRAGAVKDEGRASRAEWLLHFAEEDLDQLDRAESKTLKSELEFYITSSQYMLHAHASRLGPPLQELKECQGWLRSGLAALRDGKPWEIKLEFAPRYIVRLEHPAVIPRTPSTRPFIPFREAVLRDSIPVLLERLRFCPRPSCQCAFLKRKRKVYCTRKCSQLERSARFRTEHREQLRAARQKRYRQDMQKRLGEKVKIQTRQRRPTE